MTRYLLFVVAFTTSNAKSGKDVYARQFNASGTALGAPIQVSTKQTIPLTGPSVGSDGAGNFVVAWNGQDPNGKIAIVGRRFSAGGAALDAAPFVVSQTDQFNSTPDVSVARTSGSFVITWDYNPVVLQPGLSTEQLLAFRFVLAALGMWVLAFAVGQNPLRLTRRQVVSLIALGGVLYTAQALTYFIALRTLPASLCVLIVYIYPSLVVIAGWLFLRREVSIWHGVALLASFVGVARARFSRD